MKLHLGDCIEELRKFPENSIDAIVTDPPYSFEFMGKRWDSHKDYDAAFASWLSGFIDGEGCFRVHRHTRGTAACTFQIKLRRDDEPILQKCRNFLGFGTITYEKGDGVQKPQVKWVVQDKEGCGELVRLLVKFPLRAKKQRDFFLWCEAVHEWNIMERGNRWSGQGDYRKMRALKERIESAREYKDIPWSGNGFQDWSREWAIEALRILKPGGHVLIFCGPRTYHRMACGVEDAGFEIRDQLQWLFGSGFPKSLNIGKQLIDFEGFGTALKPANEPILLARKPLSEKTVVQNVLKWGTGGLNIDGCRVPGKLEGDPNRFAKTDGAEFVARFNIPPVVRNEGRFPANLILDETAAEMLDAQSGILKSGELKGYEIPGASRNGHLVGEAARIIEKSTASAGGASRFFYVAKTSKRERGEGNGHPTIKPIKLMTYLCRLITPPKGVILDPFMGSGSTGIAALNENFDFIGIEKESEYFEIAKRRINRVTFDFI